MGRSRSLDKMSHHSLSYLHESSLILERITAVHLTPRDVFQQIQQQWFGQPGPLTGELLADDVVVEAPFAPPGRPTRIEGKQRWLDFANPQRAASPIHIDGCRTLAIHDTTDPDTIVVEYELTGTSATTKQQGAATFIAVLTARNGKISRWREYQNTMALQQAQA
jgi:ketosteroid isomerase-like protein